jgi:peptide/nickel transport system substrate-binding protein
MKHSKLAKATSFALTACMLLSACGTGKAASSGTASGATPSKATSMTDIRTIAATDPSKLPAKVSARKDTLIVGVADMSGKFNQLWAESADDWHVSVPISGASFMDNDNKGNLIDGTASMNVSSDGLTYTFKLKGDDKYSDGSPVKIQDYVNSLKILCDKSYDGPSNSLVNYNVVGAQEYYDGKADNISGITTPDDKTLVAKLSKPNSSAQFALGGTYPISTAKYGKLIKHGDLKAFKNVDMKTYITNGPYTLTDYKEGQSATMKANKYFYKGAPKIGTIICKVVAQGAEMQAVTTGEVDVDDEVTCNADQIAIGQKAGFVNMQIQPTLGYGWVGLNHKNPLFQDQKVRQALLYAIDRKGVVKAVYGDYAHAQNINQTAESWLYTTEGINTYDYDMKKAEQLLNEAGWKKDSSGKLMKDGKEFKFMFTASKGNAVTDVLVPAMIKSYKQLGISMQAEYVDWPTLQNKFTKLTYDMSFMAWGMQADPDDSYIYKTGGSENYLGYSNKDLDKAYATALATTDKTARKAAYAKCYQIINKDLPNYIIYQRSDCIAYNTRLKTFKSAPYTPFYNNYDQIELK